ncbi:6300_t:CDS:2 [Diversispora eburnea]|uniref:6300_t:CDS:1 n=1 Tax=Diversispora eburnea TaxID=1213867 RepID=A0A9N8V053_9GLOM|nr:6300_t:CDS:2 [Diversispora eburnea]
MRERFYNRVQAGIILSNDVEKKYDNANKNVIILALPRGGVPVAYQIAQKIKAPLDVFLVRKIGVEGHEELAVGAITETSKIFNDDIIKMLHIGQDSIDRVIKRETEELQRRNQLYRKGKPATDITGKTAAIVVAVPVAAPDTLSKMSKEVDNIICTMVPRNLGGIGQFYVDFSQTEDAEVLELLKKAEEKYSVPTISAEDTAKYKNETILE